MTKEIIVYGGAWHYASNLPHISEYRWVVPIYAFDTLGFRTAKDSVYREARGGSWDDYRGHLFSAFRYNDHVSFRFPNLGFRMVCAVSDNNKRLR